jgi:hypothetical protein
MGIKRRIGLREIAGLEAGTTVWDTDVAGFGARRQKSSSVSYIVFYRTAEGRQRVFTLGRHGSPWTRRQPEKRRSASWVWSRPAENSRIAGGGSGRL